MSNGIPPPNPSKRLTMTIVGLILVMVVFVGTGVLFLFKDAVATQIVSLASVVVTAITGLVAVYCGTTAAVDWKATPPKP